MTAIRADRVGRRAGLRQALAGEWTKLASLRSSTWTLAAVPAFTVAIAVLVALTGSLHSTDSILAASLGNSVPGQLAAGAFGALLVCSEYSSGTIRATLAACPRRHTVLTAKAILAAGLVLQLALAAAAASYGLTLALLAGRGHPSGQPLPALFGIALCYAAVAVIGVALGTMIRHTAGAVTAVTVVLILPALLGPLLGDWQEAVTGATPAGALQKLADAQPAAAAATLGVWPALWLVCSYSLAALAAAGWLLQRRDT